MPLRTFAEFLQELSIRMPDPKKSMGVPRKLMPQLHADDYDDLMAFMRSKGIHSRKMDVDPNKLKPIQKDFRGPGVEKALKFRHTKKAILISKDYYVVDGNHRWIAAVNTRQDSLPAIMFMADVDTVMRTIKEFPKVTYKDLY